MKRGQIDEAGGRREYEHDAEVAEWREHERELAEARERRRRVASTPAARRMAERMRERGLIR